MNDTEPGQAQRLPGVVWAGLGTVLLLIAISFLGNQRRYQQARLDPVLEQFRVGEFILTNQLGHPISERDLKGQVWVADIIFTRCPGPCVAMTKRMRALQAALPAHLPVRLISITTDPEYDTPEVLNQYAQRFGVDPARWWFLTGPREVITNLAVGQLKLTMQEKDPTRMDTPNDLFIHSTLLVVIDRESRLRAAFESVPRIDLEEEAALDQAESKGAMASFEPIRDEIVRTVLFLSGGERWFTFRDLPALNAALNATSAFLLLWGYHAIRHGNRRTHRRCMIGALATSTLFLACYLTYHGLAGHTVFRNPAWFRPWYLVLLVSHVVLAAAIVPLVLMTVYRAVRGRWEAHKQLARWTWPLWMYVSITGVAIYFVVYWIFPQVP